VERRSIPENPVFRWIQELGSVPEDEMFRTFNMGVGMIAVIDGREREKALEVLGEEGFPCGYLERGRREVRIL